MDCKPGDLISTTDKAYDTGDIDIIKKNIPRIIEFVQYAIQSIPSIDKMKANGGIRALRLLNNHAQEGFIGELDHECFVEASKFLSIVILLPELKKTNPQAVKDAGLWEYCE
jgi:hypothetical protein